MRIPDQMLDCVVFLAVKDGEADSPQVLGTGFLVGVASAVAGKSWTYLVTAGHCVEGLKRHKHAYLRVNRTDVGGAMLLEFDADALQLADDYPATDLAMMPITLPSEHFTPIAWPIDAFATPAVIEEKEIGIGDELYIVGLFTKRMGRSRNIPIVRTGAIAAMPNETIPDPRTGVPYHAYLAEMRSIGGLSGSPVWVEIGPGRFLEKNLSPDSRQFFLLGVIRGHWPKEPYELADSHTDGGETEILNTGIATVTPIGTLVAMINEPERVANREAQERAQLEAAAAVEDSAQGSARGEFENFEDLTRKLVQTPKPSDG